MLHKHQRNAACVGGWEGAGQTRTEVIKAVTHTHTHSISQWVYSWFWSSPLRGRLERSLSGGSVRPRRQRSIGQECANKSARCLDVCHKAPTTVAALSFMAGVECYCNLLIALVNLSDYKSERARLARLTIERSESACLRATTVRFSQRHFDAWGCLTLLKVYQCLVSFWSSRLNFHGREMWKLSKSGSF